MSTRHEVGSDAITENTTGNLVNGMAYSTNESDTAQYVATQMETNNGMASSLTNSFSSALSTTTQGGSASGSIALVLNSGIGVDTTTGTETNHSQTVSVTQVTTMTPTSETETGNDQTGAYIKAEQSSSSTHEPRSSKTSRWPSAPLSTNTVRLP